MSLLGRLMGRPPVGPSAAAVPEGASNAEQQPPAVALTDIESLLPGRCITLRVIEDFFRRQFAACLRQANLGQHLESCLVFGPDTWADLRRLLLPAAGGAGAGPQGFPALERFCREHDLASKQYLLLPLLTPSHGSLLIFCQPAKQQAAGEMAGSAAPPSDRQHPLILHLDSLSGHSSFERHQPDCYALHRFLQPYRSKDGRAAQPEMITAGVPAQLAAKVGATFMCTNAIYFVANLPPMLTVEQVTRLKQYKQEPIDLYEMMPGMPTAYPGFLTTDWYPRNVPEALRKLLLSGIVEGLQGSSSADKSDLLREAEYVQQELNNASSREFEMPEDRRARQHAIKATRRLAAGRRYWEQQGGWTCEQEGMTIKCEPGSWSAKLVDEAQQQAGAQFLPRAPLFKDVEEQSAVIPGTALTADVAWVPPKPQQFDFCFGVQLQEGEQPPDFVVHIMPEEDTSQELGGCYDQYQDEQQHITATMHFAPERVTSSKGAGWLLEKDSWEKLCSLSAVSLQPGDTLQLQLRQVEADRKGSVHLDLQIDRTAQRSGQPAAVAASAAGAAGPAGAAAVDAAEDVAAAANLSALQSGLRLELLKNAAAEVAAAQPDFSPLLAAISEPTEKGRKRLQTGKGGKGDRRVRLTVNKESYYVGSYPTVEAAAQAEDLLAIWAHFHQKKTWPVNWMQECEALQPKLNYPLSFHMTAHWLLLMNLRTCIDLPGLQQMLQAHFKAVASGAPGLPASSIGKAPLASLPASHPGSGAVADLVTPVALEALPLVPPPDLEKQLGQQLDAGSGPSKRPASGARAGSSGAKRLRAARGGGAAGQQPVPAAQQAGLALQLVPLPIAQGAAVQQGADLLPQPAPQLVGLDAAAQQQTGQQAVVPQALQVDAADQQLAGPLLQLLQQGGQQAAQQAEGAVVPQQGQQPAVQPAQDLPAEGQQQLQLEAQTAHGAGTAQLQPRASGVPPLPAASECGRDSSAGARGGVGGIGGSTADAGGWSQDVRQQALKAFEAAEAAGSDDVRIAAQIDAVDAALQLPGAGLEFSERLTCTRQFRRLDRVLRAGLLAELRVIVKGGSADDLPTWMQDVARS